MKAIIQDVRHTIRMLRNNPGFTITAVLTLALGIGANTAIFSIVKAVVLKPLPFAQPQQLYALWTHLPHFGRESTSLPDYQDWRHQNTVFEHIAAYFNAAANLSGGTEPERVRYIAATANLFSVLQLRPVIGRLLIADDERAGAPKVAVLSYAFWQKKFGGRDNALGKSITLNTTSYTIVGVAPPELDAFNASDLFTTFAFTPAQLEKLRRRSDFLHVIARAKPAVSAVQIETQMNSIANRLEEQYPETNKGIGIDVSSLQTDLVGNMRPVLLSLWGSVAFMLLIVCVSVANLMLARGAAREKEMAIRAALGAHAGRLMRQLITEGIVLAGFGAALGVLLASWGIDAALALAPKDVPFVSRVHIDSTALAFAALLALVSGVIFSAVPALHGSRINLNLSLKEVGRSGAAARQTLRRVLVVAEVALSLVLLAGAGLMIRTLHELQKTMPGFNPDNLLTFRVSLPTGRYNEAQQIAFFERLIGDLRSKPGITSVGATTDLYVSGSPAYLTFQLQGAPPLPPGQSIDAQVRSITPYYLETMGVPLLQGRTITDADRKESRKVAVVNRALIERYFSGQELIGKSISLDGENWHEIVGVTGNVKQRGADSEVYPEINLPLAQSPDSAMTIVSRTAVDPTSMTSAARSAVSAIDPTLPVYAIQTMDEVMADSRAARSFQTWLLVAFAFLALLLAAIGIYGVMAQSVAQRTSEFGVRMALGAQPSQLLALVLRQGIRLAVIGLALGIFGALVLTRSLHSFLFGVSAYDPLTMVAVCLVLALIAALACFIPARRAMRIDPMLALREE